MKVACLSGVIVIFALAGCVAVNPKLLTILNQSASLKGDLPANPLQWQVITSGVDQAHSNMFTLFGNRAAVQSARTSVGPYPRGSVLAMVTWREQDDARWFGARIPAQVRSVEFIDVTAGSYRVFEGEPLKEVIRPWSEVEKRATFLLSMRAAVMP